MRFGMATPFVIMFKFNHPLYRLRSLSRIYSVLCGVRALSHVLQLIHRGLCKQRPILTDPPRLVLIAVSKSNFRNTLGRISAYLLFAEEHLLVLTMENRWARTGL